MDTKAYLQELARQSGLDAETLSGLEKALENDKFASSLGNSVSRQTDYSRNMDTLKSQQAAFEKQQQEWKDWHAGVVQADATREAELVALRARNGDPNGDPNRGVDPTQFVSKTDYQKVVADAESRAMRTSVAIAKDAMKCQMDYFQRFGKSLDLDAIEKYAVENNVTVATAYEKVIAPEVQAKQTAEFEAKLKEAHAAGVQEAMSKHNLPTEAAKSEPHMLYDDLNRKPEDRAALNTDRQRINSFTEGWNSYNANAPAKV